MEYGKHKSKGLQLCLLILWVWNFVSHAREEYSLWVFENRTLRKVVRPEGDKVMGDWRKLLSEEYHVWYTSPNIIRVIKSRIM